jgi:serine phosphatase RsbU (regulator of sigma subunit)
VNPAAFSHRRRNLSFREAPAASAQPEFAANSEAISLSEADHDLYPLIRRIAAFADLPDPVLAGLVRACSGHDFAVGDRLIAQSEHDDFAMIVLSGEVAVVNESQHGQAPLAQIAAPALVGEISALTRVPRTASVLATTPVRALRIERDVLIEMSRHAPEILLSVIGQLGGHIENMNRALGLYASGLAALERDEFDPAILEHLANPSPEVRNFGAVFRRFAKHIDRERRKREEMASAVVIQRAMLPHNLDALPLGGRCAVFGDMKPAREVGGDFFDVFMLDDDHLVLHVGDVCGKGMPACLFMSVTMTTLRLATRERKAPATMLELANGMLYEQNPSMMFATLFYGILDLATGRLDYAICGHNPPFLRTQDGNWSQLPSGGSPLGIMPQGRFGLASVDLKPGEGLFIFTDGVTESVDADGADYGEARLAAALAAAGDAAPDALVAAIMTDVDDYAGGVDQFDDITCLAVAMR